MKRSLAPHIQSHLKQKIILLSGPRQVGKTHLAKKLEENQAYYNYDIRKDLKVFRDQEFDAKAKLLIFDELHKMAKWKLWLKGLYDAGRFSNQHVIVTGSARLETMKKVGDSLAGRHLSFRLHPLDLKELKSVGTSEGNYKKLIERGGFPEPFLSPDSNFHRLWRRSHTDTILRQDLISLEALRNLDSLELLLELLASRVGSLISIKALSEDLGVSDKTVSHWLEVLEDLYVVFRLTPFSKNIPRGLKKASKFYFFDLGRIDGDEEVKIENLAALAIKKELNFLEDVWGAKTKFHFLRNKEGREIDFFVQVDKEAPHLIEVKLSDDSPSANFQTFAKFFSNAHMAQWVRNLDRRFDTREGIAVEPLVSALTNLSFKSSD